MSTSEQTAEIFTALAAFQAEAGPVGFDAQNPFFKNSYASLTAIREATRPILAKNGLAVVQGPQGDQMVTRICHKSGQWVEMCATMPGYQDEKGRSAAQAMGSIITYMRRYTFASALGIVSDEDTDGNKHAADKPATKQKPTGKQIASVVKRALSGDYDALVKFFGVFEVDAAAAEELIHCIGEAVLTDPAPEFEPDINS